VGVRRARLPRDDGTTWKKILTGHSAGRLRDPAAAIIPLDLLPFPEGLDRLPAPAED
jgi:hypothetical protein